MPEDQCLSEVPIRGTGFLIFGRKKEIKMVPKQEQGASEQVGSKLGDRKLSTPPKDSFPPMASVSQSCFKYSRRANSEDCEPKQELPSGALEPGILVYTTRPVGPVVQYTTVFLGFSFFYIVVYPLLTRAKQRVSTLLG